jgi:hypothetical protein
MSTKLSALLTIAITLCLGASSSSATTWTVEKDGTGDFTVIQDAIDAAESGDSILIGPGRFEELRVHTGLLNGVDDAAIMWVKTPGLTIIGSGSESTIIGPATYVGEFEGEKTASLVVDAGATCEVRDLGFENTRFEVNLFARTLMEDCRFVRYAFWADHSLFVGFCSGVVIRRVEMVDSGGINTLPGASNLLIEDCAIEDDSDWTYAIQISNGTPNVTVRNCTIIGGSSGIQYSGTGVVENCTLSGQVYTGLQVVGGGHMVARRCIVGTTTRSGLWVSSGRLELYDSVLEGGTRETIASTGEVFVRNSHILNAGGWTVTGRTQQPGEFIDLRHNWWGTSDPAQIEAWIDDKYGTVLWDPINDAPIPTESSSISGLKARYRAVKGSGN